MVEAVLALDVMGIKTPHYGFKDVLTLPKATSAWLDRRVRVAEFEPGWDKKLGALYKAAYKLMRELLGQGWGGVLGLDLTGESQPTEPHYHFNVYTFPAVRTGGVWEALPQLISPAALEFAKKRWPELVRKALGKDKPGLKGWERADIEHKYLGSRERLGHWLRYLYRSPLHDLWRGIQGSEGEGVDYIKGKTSLTLSAEALRAALGRMAAFPKHFNRVRWGGIFSDAQKAAAMRSLCLDSEIVEGEEGQEKWVTVETGYRFVRTTPGGLLLMRQGEVVEILDAEINYASDGVTLGRRKRWYPPGFRRGDLR